MQKSLGINWVQLVNDFSLIELVEHKYTLQSTSEAKSDLDVLIQYAEAMPKRLKKAKKEESKQQSIL